MPFVGLGVPFEAPENDSDNGRSAVAEFMAAITALEIAEDFFVHDIADFGAGHGTSSATEQTTEDCAC
jgi:hypothetical protein